MGFLSINSTHTHQMMNPFITEWDVNGSNDTTTFFNTITIPLQSGTYNFDYTWTLVANPSIQISGTHTNADGDFTTDFTTGEFYELSIDGQFPHMRDYPKDKLIDVIQWGDIVWSNMQSMFEGWPGAGFSATDEPDLSSVTNMNSMFRNTPNFNGNIVNWDVSNITNFFRLFQGAASFNQDISTWSVSKVSNMNGLFENATSFNQNINGWDVSSVQNLSQAFRNTDGFNQPIGNWDVSNVTEMTSMFRDNDIFNQDISMWDVSSVTSLRNMFFNAISFNQPIGNWDVNNVNTFREMFAGANAFNQSLGNWKFKSGANFLATFNGANSIDCQSWSSTILGWNFSNPNLNNLNPGGSNNFEYDSIAAIAYNELVNQRGWTINGTAIGGDCGATFEFPCSDTLQIQNDTLFGNLTLSGNMQVDLKNVVIIQPSDILITTPLVNIDSLTEVKSGSNFEIINAAGCN